MVTILVPVYNTSKYLRQCLDSITAQTYQNLQVVLVDDGSTDDSLSICEEYAGKYSYIEVHHQANAGVAAARNKLLSYIAGDYVLFVDSDDWIEPQTVEYLVAEARYSQVDIVTCSAIINDGPITVKEIQKEEWSQERTVLEFLRHVIFNGSLWNKLIKAERIKGIQFAKEISYGEDALFIWQVLQRVQKVLITNRQLYHYRMNEDSISHQTFGPKKMTGHIVWEQINSVTEQLWPQYLEIARAGLAISDMWLLYFAAQNNYRYDSFIGAFQQTVRRYFKQMRNAQIIGKRKLIFAVIISHSYRLGCLLLKIIK